MHLLRYVGTAAVAMLLLAVSLSAGPAQADAPLPDDQVFIADADNLYVSDAATLDAVTDISGSLTTAFDAGFDDGDHMVVDSHGERVFVSDHDNQFDVFDITLIQHFPTWGVSLDEPLGVEELPDGKILITDEEDDGSGGEEGLFRLTSDLGTVDATASGSYDLDGPEGVVYDTVHDRIYVADEDDGDIEIFNGSTLAHIASVDALIDTDGPYWLGVDGSSNRLFFVADDDLSGDWGIHVFDITSGGDDLTFNKTIPGSLGLSADCYGTLAVSESTDRLFAIDYCGDFNVVDIYDTVTLAFLGTVPASRAGDNPLMVSTGHIGPTITLDPPTAINDVSTDHTVTATVNDGDHVVGTEVTFEVTDGPNSGDTGKDTTDTNGQATFTYTGDGGAGTDTIEACVTFVLTPPPNNTNDVQATGVEEVQQVSGEICTTATKDWVEPEPTPGPSPTPTVLAAAALPTTGGTPSDGGASALAWLATIAGAIALIGSGSAWFAYQRRRVR